MDKKVIGFVVAVLVVLGGGYFAFNGMSKDSSEGTTPNEAETMTETETGSDSGRKMSFSSFLKQGGSYMCTVSQYLGEIESKGTVYVDGNNVRGTFATNVSGMNVNSEFLSTGGYTYSWSSQMAGKGFKTPISDTTDGDTGTGTSGEYSFNADQIGDYNCEAWSVDKSKFTVPSGISFTELKQ